MIPTYETDQDENVDIALGELFPDIPIQGPDIKYTINVTFIGGLVGLFTYHLALRSRATLSFNQNYTLYRNSIPREVILLELQIAKT